MVSALFTGRRLRAVSGASFVVQALRLPVAESTHLPDSYCPDRTKVVLLNDQESGRLIAHCDPNVPAPWRREPIYSLLKTAAGTRWATGGLVIAVSGCTQWLITPTDDLDMGRIDPATRYRIRETPDGELLLSILVNTNSVEQPSVVERVLRRPGPHRFRTQIR